MQSGDGCWFRFGAPRQPAARGSRRGDRARGRFAGPETNDIAIQKGGEPVETIIRYHTALRELTGRRGIRDDVSRYEAVAMALVESNTAAPGTLLEGFPPQDSPLRLEQFFQALYLRYDERYVYAAPDLKSITRRREWSEASPALMDPEHAANRAALGYEPRIAVG
jgi:hypothetical protein